MSYWLSLFGKYQYTELEGIKLKKYEILEKSKIDIPNFSLWKQLQN